MLTPMLVQYLVGLCCLRHNPDAVDVTVGDLVLDVAAKKKRDVDVTVTVKEDGSVRAFKAYEVKKEGKPLDVATIEQLSIKLRDMQEVTHRAIVSTSSFSEGAINKAAAHQVELFELKPWTKPIESQFPDFPNIGLPDTFFSSFESSLLYWIDARTHLIIPTGPSSFTWLPATPVFTPKGQKHKKFANMEAFNNAMLLRSASALFAIEPAWTILRTFPFYSRPNKDFVEGPPWPHTHTLQVAQDNVFLNLDGKLHKIETVTISGSLQWRRKKIVPQFYSMESVPGGMVFAGSIIADWGADDGKMLAIIFPPRTRELGIHQFQLSERHRNIIRGLKIRSENANKTTS
ncbi:MAG: hypothetical protein ACLQF2_08390 [Rhodomicrobium sp.]